MRRLLFLFVLLCSPLWPTAATAQSSDAPLYESRAVWFATVLRDGNWPVRGTVGTIQERDLRSRIQTAKSRGMNTFVFQAVARGDAMYPSERLPWSPKLKGAGQDPGYDPLAVAVDEAHRLGMELHMWFNTFRVGDSGTLSTFAGVEDPAHVAYAQPGWVVTKNGDLYLDPSSPDAREWLVGNLMEIVEAYDVDAVQFDFIRYPQGGLPDDDLRFQADPRGFTDIADWRRDNVTQFVRDAYAAVLAAKPWVKVSSTPIGRYEGGRGDFVGYNGVFQASREWLVDGIHDYLAPQIYWDLSNWPYFDQLANEWVDATNGLPIITGIGAYQTGVQIEMREIIDASRAAGAEGQMYFRYDHLLSNSSAILEKYPYPALPAPMTHRFEAAAPGVPADVAIALDGETSVNVSWAPSEGSAQDPLRAYAVFRREGAAPDVGRAEDLFDVVDGRVTSFTEAFAEAPAAPVYYRVVALSMLGIASEGSASVSTDQTALPVADAEVPAAARLVSVYPNPAAGAATVVYEAVGGEPVRLTVYDVLGRRVQVLVDAPQAPGRHEVRLDASRLTPGVYVCELRAGAHREVRRLVVSR